MYKGNNYRYFVSFSYAAINKAGMNNMEISLGKKIECMGDIRYLQTYIKNKYNCEEVIVIDFRLLKIEEEK